MFLRGSRQTSELPVAGDFRKAPFAAAGSGVFTADMSESRTTSGKVLVAALGAFLLVAGALLFWASGHADIDVPSSGRYPRSIAAAALPDPTSEGAQLLQKYCVSCHPLPDPAFHPAADWTESLADMELRIQTRIMRAAPMPSHPEWRAIEAYLKAHAADTVVAQP